MAYCKQHINLQLGTQSQVKSTHNDCKLERFRVEFFPFYTLDYIITTFSFLIKSCKNVCAKVIFEKKEEKVFFISFSKLIEERWREFQIQKVCCCCECGKCFKTFIDKNVRVHYFVHNQIIFREAPEVDPTKLCFSSFSNF